MLPVVVEGGTKVGSLCKDWFGIRCGTPVLAGLGDLQCSFLSAVQTDTDAGKALECFNLVHFHFFLNLLFFEKEKNELFD